MDTNYTDLLNPIFDRFNKEVAELSIFLEEQLALENHIYVPSRNRYGVIERITICSKTGNQKTVEVWTYMDGSMDVRHFLDQGMVHKEGQVQLWSPSDLTKVLERIKTFLLTESPVLV